MIKTILCTVIAISVSVITVIVFYWKDSGFEPSAQDLGVYLGAIPLAISFFVISPYLIYKFYRYKRDKKQNITQESHQDQILVEEKCEQKEVQLSIYSSFLTHALGEDEDILPHIIDLRAPKLGNFLEDQEGNPVLTYQIDDLEETESNNINALQQRMHALLRKQLEKNDDVLQKISYHFKRSAMFYHYKTVEKYRLHPAWIDANYQEVSEDVEKIEAVPRLNQFIIYVLLAQHAFHVWNTSITTNLIEDYLVKLGFLNEQIDIKYEFLSSKNDYFSILNHFKDASTSPDDVLMYFCLDSEIDQSIFNHLLDNNSNYIPAEFAGSIVLTSCTTNIIDLKPIHIMNVIFDQTDLLQILKDKNMHQSSLLKSDQPFVLVADDMSQPKKIENIHKHFQGTEIQNYHCIYSAASLGHTQSLSKVYSLILGLVSFKNAQGIVYTADYPDIHVFIDSNLPTAVDTQSLTSTQN